MSARPLHVVAHNASAVLGGGEIGTALLLGALQERGHRVRMLCRDRSMAERLRSYDITVGVQRIGGDLAIHDAFRFARTLRRLRPDALLLTTFKKVALASLGARLAGVPFVVQRVVLQGDDPRRGRRYRFALRHWVDAITLNADAMRPPFIDAASGLDPGSVLTIHDGVRPPTTARTREQVRSELGIPLDAVVVGAAARLARQKRFDRLLRAVAEAQASERGRMHVLIAGEGEERERLESLARELGIAERLHLPGFRTDVGDMLASMDVYVISSDREGMANAMLEAMAAGVPVVSTDVSGAREALLPDDGVAAGAVVGLDTAELAAALARLAADPALRTRLGAAAAERAEAAFGWERFVSEWEALLARGVAGGRPAPRTSP